MIKKRDKRGSHVEVMIAFVIFVTFIVFLASILRPAVTMQKDKKSFLNLLEMEVSENASAELKIITFSLTWPMTDDCIELQGELSNLGIGPNVVVKDYSGNIVNSYISPGTGNLKIERGSTTDYFFKIYYSEELEELQTQAGPCRNIIRDNDYVLGLVKTQDYVFETKISELIEQYDNYDSLKKYFKFPNGTDFGFGLVLENKTIIQTNMTDSATSIFIKESPIQYVSQNGNISLGYLKTIIW